MASLSPTRLHRHARRGVQRLLSTLVGDEKTIHVPTATRAAEAGPVAPGFHFSAFCREKMPRNYVLGGRSPL